MRLVDLHTHSTASDGSDSPARIVELAAGLNLTAVALTDHDTLAGLAEAQAASVGRDLEFVRGIELSSAQNDNEIHVLGLWLPMEPQLLQGLTEHLREANANRVLRNQQMLERIQALGLSLTWEEVEAEARGKVIGRPHMARALLRKGLIANLNEAYTRYLGQRGAAYVPRVLPTPQEGVEILAAAKALPCLAHPCLSLKERDKLEELIRNLIPCGLQGLEAYHSEHSAADIRFCVEMAHKYNLGLSGGSDYHGALKPAVKLAYGRGGLRVSELIYQDLRRRRYQ